MIIQGSTLIPDIQNIPAGALVLWYNDDSIDHTVTARDNSFDSGSISPNETFEYTFEHPRKPIFPGWIRAVVMIEKQQEKGPVSLPID